MPERIEIPLSAIHIARPCHADWNAMEGDDRARFCRTCEKHVYNLSALTRAEAQELVNSKEGRMCVRFYQRADGTMLTQDCPVGQRTARTRLSAGLLAGLAACCSFALGLIEMSAHVHAKPLKLDSGDSALMGDVIARPTPKPTPTATPSIPAD